MPATPSVTGVMLAHTARLDLTGRRPRRRQQEEPIVLMMENDFVPDGFDVPTAFAGPGFRLEPLGPQHNEQDHEAWMSSIDHIRSTPGFPDGEWPEPMSPDRNLQDLIRHARDFQSRTGFTYSILDGDEVIGCVYIYPSRLPGSDAGVQSWVRESRAEMDVVVWRALSAWIETEWPFVNPHYEPRL